MRVRNIAAVIIQKIFRGVNERKSALPMLRSKREKDQLKKEQKSRMRDIQQKEKDLMLLSQLSPDQYLEYERMRKNMSAKVIQNAWKQSSQNPNNMKYNELYQKKFGGRKSALRNAKFFPFRASKEKFSSEEERKQKEELQKAKDQDKFFKERSRLNLSLTSSYNYHGFKTPYVPISRGNQF